MITTIRSYISSDGSVKDYLVEEIGPEGYIQLCQESVNQLNSEIDRQMLHKEYDEDEVQALIELRDSYQKTISGEQPERQFTFEEGVRYLRHCKIIAVHEIRPAITKHKTYRNNVTMYKAQWRKKLPIAAYVGQFKLEPIKVGLVMLGLDSTVDWVYL